MGPDPSSQTSAPSSARPGLGARIGRIPVTRVSPVVEGGAYPAKATLGEAVPIRAAVFREGHDAVSATLVLTDPDGAERRVLARPLGGAPAGLVVVVARRLRHRVRGT